jgi:hypothetical protein
LATGTSFEIRQVALKMIANQLFIGEPLSAIYDYNKLGIWQLSRSCPSCKIW